MVEAPDPPAGRMATLSGTVFTPQRLLLLFCCINMVVYIDRGALVSRGMYADEKVVKLHYSKNASGVYPSACICLDAYRAGVISSNGVNGAANEPGKPGTGIQVRPLGARSIATSTDDCLKSDHAA